MVSPDVMWLPPADLERRERDLLAEQEFIRGDVQRLSLQLEELNELIQVHIARNTACLDAGSLQKRWFPDSHVHTPSSSVFIPPHSQLLVYYI